MLSYSRLLDFARDDGSFLENWVRQSRVVSIPENVVIATDRRESSNQNPSFFAMSLLTLSLLTVKKMVWSLTNFSEQYQ